MILPTIQSFRLITKARGGTSLRSASHGALFLCFFLCLCGQEELHQEDDREDIGEDRDLFPLAGAQLDAAVGDERQADAVADGAGDRHGQQHDGHGKQLGHVGEIDVLEVAEHEDTHIDQSGGGGRRGDDGRHRGDEHTGQEEDAGGEGGQAGAAARLHAGGRFHKGGDGARAGEGACHGADGVGQQGLAHLGHIPVFVQHPGAGGRAHQGADGVEHINDAEGDDERHGGKGPDVHKAAEIQLEQRGLGHVGKGRQEGRPRQGGKGIDVKEDGFAAPIDDRGHQHPQQHRALDLFMGQSDDDEQTHEHGHHSQHHGGVARAHGLLGNRSGEGAEEIPHDIEGAAGLRINAGVGAKTDVHEHQADGGADAQTHPLGDSFHDLFPDAEEGEENEDDPLDEDDDQGRLEGFHIGHPGHGDDVGHHQGKEAVEPHPGGHGKGLVGQKRHGDGADGRGDAGGQEHAVPQLGPAVGAKAGEQIGVEGHDIGHGHEGGQAGHDLRADGGAVLLQMKELFHAGIPPKSVYFLFCPGAGPAFTKRFHFTGFSRKMQAQRGFFGIFAGKGGFFVPKAGEHTKTPAAVCRGGLRKKGKRGEGVSECCRA